MFVYDLGPLILYFSSRHFLPDFVNSFLVVVLILAFEVFFQYIKVICSLKAL